MGKKQNNKFKLFLVGLFVFVLCSFIVFRYEVVDQNTQYCVENAIQSEIRMIPENNQYLKSISLLTKAGCSDFTVHMVLLDNKGYFLYENEEKLEEETTLEMLAKKKLREQEQYTVQISLSDAEGNQVEPGKYLQEIQFLEYEYKTLPVRFLAFLEILLAAGIAGVLLFIMKKEKIMQYINNVVRSFETMQPEKADYIIWFLLFTGVFASFMYGDTKAFVYYIFDFWGSVSEGGGIRYFREYAYQMFLQYRQSGINEAYAANYNFSIHLLLGIWGLPLWFIAKATNTIGVVSLWMLLYTKALFVVFILITAFIIYKICLNMAVPKNNAKWAAYLFMSSALVFAEIGLIGQLDILGVPFTLLGIYYFQKKAPWRFLLFFAIAVTFKQFPFFIFVPLLLLVEKNVIKIAIKAIFVLGFSTMIELPLVRDTVATQYKADFSQNSLSVLLGVKFPLYNDTVPIVILMLGTICVYCYLKKIENQRQLQEYSLFISTLAITVVMISFDGNPYWYLILAPFYSILVIYHAKQFKNLILFEMLGMGALVLNQYGANYWCFEPTFGQGAILDKIMGYPNDFFTMKTLSGYLRIDVYSGVLFAIFVVCSGAILYLSRPGKIEQQEQIVVKPFAVLRLLINAGIAYIPIALYIVSYILYH